MTDFKKFDPTDYSKPVVYGNSSTPPAMNAASQPANQKWEAIPTMFDGGKLVVAGRTIALCDMGAAREIAAEHNASLAAPVDNSAACSEFENLESHQRVKGSATSGEVESIAMNPDAMIILTQGYPSDAVIRVVDAHVQRQVRAAFAASAEQSPPDPDGKFAQGMLTQLARMGASPAALSLAVQLFGVGPCAACGFRKLHCRCPAPAPVAERAAAPASVPEADAILAARAEGRAEALEILTGLDAEGGIDEYTGWSTPVSGDDEGSAYWEIEKLRDLFKVDDKLHNLFERAEGMYWEALGKSDDADRMMCMAKRAPHFQPLHDFLAKHQAWDLMHDLQRADEPNFAAPEVAQPAVQGDRTAPSEEFDSEQLRCLLAELDDNMSKEEYKKVVRDITNFVLKWGATQRRAGQLDMTETITTWGESQRQAGERTADAALVAENRALVEKLRDGHEVVLLIASTTTDPHAAKLATDNLSIFATPTSTATLSKQEIARLIEQHTGMTKRQDERSYADLAKLVNAVLNAAPTDGEESARTDALCNSALRAEPAGLDGACIECKGTGMADSGGTHPWGEPALIPCGCKASLTAPATRTSVLRDDWASIAPTDQGWYWHWNGDPDAAPFPLSVLYSGTAKKCFVSMNQTESGGAEWCDTHGGYWMRMREPDIAGATAQEVAQ